MVPRPRNGLSLCAGGGGLDMGIGLAEPSFHTRCYVEWEEYPRSTIIAAQNAGYFVPAPIWDDVRSFDAKPFAGVFDTLLAGYPCQGESLAGKRKGKDDERWLWEDIERIIEELGPTLRWCIFENVKGHVSLGLETVLRALYRLGFTTSVGIFSAEETGAPHERQRVFIVAYRESHIRWSEQQPQGTRRWRSGPSGSRTELDNAEQLRRRTRGNGCYGKHVGEQLDAESSSVANSDGRDTRSERKRRCGKQRLQQESRGIGQNDQLANTSKAHPQRVRGGNHAQGWQEPAGSARPPCRTRVFPPRPSDADAWTKVLTESPHLAPAVGLDDCIRFARNIAASLENPRETALEPTLRRMAHGLALRSRALRLLGNGVHPLAAAYAWRALSAAHGLRPLDLATAANRHP